MQETWVQMLGWDDSLEEEMATNSSILAWKTHGQRRLAGYHSWGSKESDMTKHECLIEVMFYNFCSSLFLAINY